MTRNVTVIGAGSFGTALANHIAGNSHDVTLWGRNPDTLRDITKDGENSRYLPGVRLHQSIVCNPDLPDALQSATDVLVATPSQHFSEYLSQIASHTQDSCSVLWACKGLESGSCRFLSDVAKDQIGARNYAVISGPTFARELAAGQPTAIVTAANHEAYAQSVVKLMHNPRFRTYVSDDIKGVQLGGALKNVYAIAAGISDGLSFGANARVAVITRGLAELKRLGEKFDVRTETLMGLSGVGDLILTCTDDQSRNRRFGLLLGSGKSSEEALAQIGQSVEGVKATEIAHQLAQKHTVSMPIVEQVQQVIIGKITPADGVAALLSRASTSERI